MTAIAALVDEVGVIWMGGDSAGVTADTLRLSVRKDEKIFMNGPMLLGFSSSYRMGNLLHYTFILPQQPEGMPDDCYMNTLFIDAVRECFKNGGFTRIENEQESGGSFIIGYKNTLYEIDSDFQVAIPTDLFVAVGCGADLCLGSLYSTIGQPPEDRIKIALNAAERFSAGVRQPFIIKHM